jgi:PTS system nitrogen regulatory IIA component
MFPPKFIAVERVATRVEIGSKKRLLEVLGELLARNDLTLSPEGVFGHLLERERLGSTGLGHGIALPHARMKGVTEAIGAFVQIGTGIDFDAVDDEPVDLAFAMLVPEAASEMHLQLLSTLAAIFSDAATREALRRADSPEDVIELLAAAEERSRAQ